MLCVSGHQARSEEFTYAPAEKMNYWRDEMRRGKVGSIGCGLALSAVVIAGSVSSAFGATTYTTTATGSSKGGSKAAPAPFSGAWTLKGDAGPGVRPATPVSWSWSWEGVVLNGKGMPMCTAAQIDAAQSDSVCPKGSLLGRGVDLIAQFGPIGDPLSNVNCNGKDFLFYNAGKTAMTLHIVGPADQCGGLDYIAPTVISLSTKAKRTTATINWPNNITNPLPGLQATLNFGQSVFPVVKNKVKQGKKKVKKSYANSVGCKGTRDFVFTVVDEEGSGVTQTQSVGKCTQPKAKKKK
jgi:hypothetical protein